MTIRTRDQVRAPVVQRELDAEALRGLARDHITAVHVPGYCSDHVATTLADWCLRAPEGFEMWRFYTAGGSGAENDVETVGTPLGVALRQGTVARYFEQAATATTTMRQLCRPEPSPIDRLRLELDEQFPQGSLLSVFRADAAEAGEELAKFSGRKLKAAIPRVMRAGPSRRQAEVHPHWDFRRGARGPSYTGLFSANVYLRMPDRGGELEIWPVTGDSVEPMLRELVGAGDFTEETWRRFGQRLRERLPQPWVLQPHPRDLILINTKFVHAVAGFDRGVRVTLQTFIDLFEDKPLMLRA
jgi:hypothetical protein